MRTRLTLLISMILLSTSLLAGPGPEWGSTGHRAIGEIAEKHLSKKARRNIESLLNGRSLSYVSTYADEIKSDDVYDKYYTWHFVNFPLDGRYEDSVKEPKGDIITGIQHCIDVLEDDTSSESDKVFFLKMLVHFIGDMHQPLHIGRAEDKGGNDIKVKWHYKKTNLHRVWDSDMINSWDMSYTELEENTKSLSKEQVQAIARGSVIDWMYETRELTKKVYASAKDGDNLGYRYSYVHLDTVFDQLQKAGIRLAKVLNEVFG